MDKLPKPTDPDFWTGRGCVSIIGVFLAFLAVLVGIFYTWQGFTNELLMVIVFLLAGILFVLATRREPKQ